MDVQDLKEELHKILELSSSRVNALGAEQNTFNYASGIELKKAPSSVSFKGNPDLESSLEAATDNVIPTNMSFATLNLDKPPSYESIKTDLSAIVTNTTLNIAADEFIPAKDIHDLLNLTKIPSATRPFSRAGEKQDESVASVMQAFEDQLMSGQNSNEHIQDEKSQFPSKIPRLVNDFYFPREMSIREYREMNDQYNADISTSQTYLRRLSKLNVNDSRFPGEDNDMSIRELREISDQKKAEMHENLAEQHKMVDSAPEGKIVTIGGVEKLTFNRPENDDEETYTAGGSSNLTMPLIASALSMEAFLIDRLRHAEDGSTYPSPNLNPTGVQDHPTVIYESLARRSSFSLKPQTSLAALTAESQAAIVDDDGFERNFPKVPSGNLSSVESTVWMDNNASFVIEEPAVANYHHTKLSEGLREQFPKPSQNMDDNSSIDICVPQTSQNAQATNQEMTKKKTRKSIVKRISNLIQRLSAKKE